MGKGIFKMQQNKTYVMITTDKAIERLAYTITKQNKPNQTDLDSLKVIAEFVEKSKKQEITNNYLFAKMYVYSFLHEISYYNESFDTNYAFSQRKLNSVLKMSLEDNIKCTIRSPLSEFVLESDDPFAIMLAVTTNGGLKVISLLGEIELKQKQKPSTSLRPGQLIFSLPDSFSRKMSVELSTLMVTSKLMTGFDEPPVFLKKLKQQALIQALRTKKRFKTVVGDAKTNSDFQIQVLQEK